MEVDKPEEKKDKDQADKAKPTKDSFEELTFPSDSTALTMLNSMHAVRLLLRPRGGGAVSYERGTPVGAGKGGTGAWFRV